MNPLVYEINTRCWLTELSQKAGDRLTLADVPDGEFAFWQRCGFTHIWLMGVWRVGARGRAWSQACFRNRQGDSPVGEVAGSPFAITGYDVSRKLGGETALANFRRKLDRRGIKLILDFIPNHTALDHPWVKTNPSFYVASEKQKNGTTKAYRRTKWFAHGYCGHGSPWMDTLQLDYRNPELRETMIHELLGVAEKCDGVRCDMAMLQLNEVFSKIWRDFKTGYPEATTEFWADAINTVRARTTGFLFLAEVYWDLEARLQEVGFDLAYDKRLYDHLIARDAPRVTTYIHSLAPQFLARSVHFIENHDEVRIASLLSFEEIRAAGLLILGLPGGRLLHEGQLAGMRIHADMHFVGPRFELPDKNIFAFYERVFSALKKSSVGQGHGALLKPRPAWRDNPSYDNIVVVQWQSNLGAFDLVVVNLSATRSQCYVPLRVECAAGAWRLTDLLGEEVHERSGPDLEAGGLYLDLEPHAAQLFHCEQIP